MSAEVKVYAMPDKQNGEEGWWSACCDFDDSPMYDASGRSPAEAFGRLAEVLAEALSDAVDEERAK